MQQILRTVVDGDMATTGAQGSMRLLPVAMSNGSDQHDVRQVYSARVPTAAGDFMTTVYQDTAGKEHVAMAMGDVRSGTVVVRIHSECLTGDVFGSLRCDCREQLTAAIQRITQEGQGVLVYMRQEGRGIGLANKIQAYALQDQGLDTVDANLHLGLPADGRDFRMAAEILRREGVTRVRLLTNNPQKIADLEAEGVEVVERIPLQIPPRPDNRRYLETKAQRLGHLFEDLADRVDP